jgi:hypothetical protein
MSAEISYLYLCMATAINNWSAMRANTIGWRAFRMGWLCLALFAATLVVDYGK